MIHYKIASNNHWTKPLSDEMSSHHRCQVSLQVVKSEIELFFTFIYFGQS